MLCIVEVPDIFHELLRTFTLVYQGEKKNVMSEIMRTLKNKAYVS